MVVGINSKTPRKTKDRMTLWVIYYSTSPHFTQIPFWCIVKEESVKLLSPKPSDHIFCRQSKIPREIQLRFEFKNLHVFLRVDAIESNSLLVPKTTIPIWANIDSIRDYIIILLAWIATLSVVNYFCWTIILFLASQVFHLINLGRTLQAFFIILLCWSFMRVCWFQFWNISYQLWGISKLL